MFSLILNRYLFYTNIIRILWSISKEDFPKLCKLQAPKSWGPYLLAWNHCNRCNVFSMLIHTAGSFMVSFVRYSDTATVSLMWFPSCEQLVSIIQLLENHSAHVFPVSSLLLNLIPFELTLLWGSYLILNFTCLCATK